jgi:CelD/BcsL family acetyltransferase involved in cellulose biosynthesis
MVDHPVSRSPGAADRMAAGLAARPVAATVETIDGVERFRALRDAWRDLQEDSDAGSPFLTWEWMFTWWRHLSAGRRLSILAVWRRRELMAIAPLALRRRWLPRLLVPAGFVGTGSVGPDYLDLIVRRGRTEEAMEALAGHLDSGRIILDLAQIHAGSRAARDLARRLRLRGWSLRETRTDVCPFIRLSGHTWESYLDTLGPRHRYNFRRRLRNLETRHDLAFERAGSPAEVRQALALLVALHRLRWQERGGTNAFHTRALVAFHQELAAQASERGWLRLFVLSLDGRPAAALYGLRYRRTFYFYQCGFDPGFRKESVGLVTLGLAIRSALEEGVAEFDLLHGAEEYKFRWAREARDLGRIGLYPPEARGLLHRAVERALRGARRVARRLLPRTLAAGPRSGEEHAG